uniref:Uncharacterized protein n=1 Tax=Rhizophora mucronata TaxID=61149 RepID=A0A2P2NMF1_RHIMU
MEAQTGTSYLQQLRPSNTELLHDKPTHVHYVGQSNITQIIIKTNVQHQKLRIR